MAQIIKNKSDKCIFCLISSNKIQSKKVYEDDDFMAILDIYPASKGHILLFPKDHIKTISELPQEIFSIAKNLTLVLKQISAGVNLFIAEGEIAGQKSEHMVIHLIPRYIDDNLPLTWNPQKISEEELNEIQKEIISKVEIPKKETPKEEIIKEEIEEIKDYSDFDEEERFP